MDSGTNAEETPLLREEKSLEAPTTRIRTRHRRPKRISTTRAIIIAVLCCSLFIILPGSLAGWLSVRRLLKNGFSFAGSTSTSPRLPLLDGHNDFPGFLRQFYNNQIAKLNDSMELPGQVDFPRLAAGGLAGQFWSVFTPCPKSNDPKDFSDDLYGTSVRDTLQQIDVVNRLIDKFPQQLSQAWSAGFAWYLMQQEGKRIASFMGVEGLHQIGNSAAVLRLYHQLGVRYITLTHNCNNKYADAAIVEGVDGDAPAHGGLSDAGRDIVLEMNRVGLLVDLSHTSADTMRDALAVSKAPVIFSHSNARAVCDHRRNVPDDVLLSLKKNGGVIMVTFVPDFVNCENSDDASLNDVVRHILYIGRLIGFEHVGIGSDFDGSPSMPRNLEDVKKYPDLFKALAEHGLSRRDLDGIAGTNVIRVLAQAEELRFHMQQSGVKPLEDEATAWAIEL